MNLAKLIQSAKIDGLSIEGNIAGVEVADLTLDSRQTKSGGLFAALPGTRVNGSQFASDAISAGAVGILAGCDVALNIPENTVVLRHEKPAYALSQLCRTFFGNLPNTLVAVTGTNGKTSVVNFLRQIWQSSGKNAASLGTLGVLPKGIVSIPELTSPDAITLHRALSGLKNAGIDSVALEASSHGLAQHRLDGLNIHIAGFTNLSRDHLDHHDGMEEYFAAKARLFTELLLDGGSAVINIDDEHGVRLAAMLRDATPRRHVIVTVGQDDSADFRITAITAMEFGLEITVEHAGRGYRIPVALAGAFQAVNAVTAAVMAHVSGLPLHDTLFALPFVTGAEGRMQLVTGHPSGARVIVDYAHTPDALQAALVALRPEAKGRLAVLFGAGGDRDAGKRPMMGKVAHEHADIAYVTDDNPRSEDAGDIRKAIIATCPNAIEIADRGTAINRALDDLDAGDVLLIAGKGHENFQLVGDETLPFSDSSVAKNAIIGMTATGGDA